MNNLVLIKEKIQRAERLHKAKLLATKKGEVASYRRSTYEKRRKQAQIDFESNE